MHVDANACKCMFCNANDANYNYNFNNKNNFNSIYKNNSNFDTNCHTERGGAARPRPPAQREKISVRGKRWGRANPSGHFLRKEAN